MEWASAVIAALNVSGRVYVALKALEQQAAGAPREVRQVSSNLTQLESTLSKIQAHCESPPHTLQGPSAKVLKLRKDFGLLRDFLVESISIPKWKLGAATDLAVTCQAVESRKFFDALEHVKQLAVDTLNQWDGDIQQLHLTDLFAFLPNFGGAGNSALSMRPRRPLCDVQFNEVTKTTKRRPQMNLVEQVPASKKRRNSSSLLHSGVETLPRRPQTRSMTAKKSAPPLTGSEELHTAPDSSHRAHQSPEHQDSPTGGEVSGTSSSSKPNQDLNARIDRLEYDNDQLLNDIAQLQKELENDLIDIS